jgi:endoglucanase
MPDISPFLKSMLSAPGLSGHETPIARIIEEKWRPLVDEISFSRIGSLHGLKKGTSTVEKRPSVMVATHMDAIGLMATHVIDGLIRFTQVGGIDSRILPGTPVTVHGTEDIPGVVVLPPGKTLPPSVGDGVVDMQYLWVDTGLLPKEVAAKVRTGDPISYASTPTELSGEVISGHTLDNRASVAALTVALEELQSKKHAWDVWAVATVQEEVTLGGAFTSSFGLRPELAIAVDVTFAKGPGASDWQTHGLGKGAAIGLGPNVHPFLQKKFKELAEKLEIPFEMDVMPRMSGTDGYATQITAEGIPTAILGIPLRYMHTPVEVVSYKDINRVGRLVAEFIASLDVDFVSKITWED